MLFGGDGNDTLIGGEVYYDDGGGETDFGSDTLNGEAGNDRMVGGAGDDALNGGSGDDLLYGGSGDDSMDGGDGVDTVTYAFSSAAVRLTLDGSNEVTPIFGNSPSDRLRKIENVVGSYKGDEFGGDDLVNVLRGLGGADILHGGGADDVLIGGVGTDTLRGDDGRDSFRFDAPGEGGDTIEDFSRGATDAASDHLVFRSSAFGGIGAITSDNFVTNESGQASDAEHRFVFEADTSILRYDADGSGAGEAVLIATLDNVESLSGADFLFI